MQDYYGAYLIYLRSQPNGPYQVLLAQRQVINYRATLGPDIGNNNVLYLVGNPGEYTYPGGKVEDQDQQNPNDYMALQGARAAVREFQEETLSQKVGPVVVYELGSYSEPVVENNINFHFTFYVAFQSDNENMHGQQAFQPPTNDLDTRNVWLATTEAYFPITDENKLANNLGEPVTDDNAPEMHKLEWLTIDEALSKYNLNDHNQWRDEQFQNVRVIAHSNQYQIAPRSKTILNKIDQGNRDIPVSYPQALQSLRQLLSTPEGIMQLRDPQLRHTIL